MSQHLPILKPAKVLRTLQRAGFYIHPSKVHIISSSIPISRTFVSRFRSMAPISSAERLSRLLKQAGFSIEEFLELL